MVLESGRPRALQIPSEKHLIGRSGGGRDGGRWAGCDRSFGGRVGSAAVGGVRVGAGPVIQDSGERNHSSLTARSRPAARCCPRDGRAPGEASTGGTEIGAERWR